MEDARVKLSSRSVAERLFALLLAKSGCKTLRQLSQKLNVPYGRLIMWSGNRRSIPTALFEKWLEDFQLDKGQFSYVEFDLQSTLINASAKGVQKLAKKLGPNWHKLIGSRGQKRLREKMSKDPKLMRKWKASTKAGLKAKYGENCFTEIGRLGGRASLASKSSEELAAWREKAFRNSFRGKIFVKGQRFRSKKEGEVPISCQKTAFHLSTKAKL